MTSRCRAGRAGLSASSQSQNSAAPAAGSGPPGFGICRRACRSQAPGVGRRLSGRGSQAIRRCRRHRSVAIRRAMTRSHGSGRPAGPCPERQAANARANVSATISSTSSRPRVDEDHVSRHVPVMRAVDRLERAGASLEKAGRWALLRDEDQQLIEPLDRDALHGWYQRTRWPPRPILRPAWTSGCGASVVAEGRL